MSWQNPNTMSPTRIIVTETEETYYQVKVVTGERVSMQNVEISATDKLLNDKVWVREQFMYDTTSMEDRLHFTTVLQEMVSIMVEEAGMVIQVVYETDESRWPDIRALGYTGVNIQASNMSYFIRELVPSAPGSNSDDVVALYENISTDIEHIDNFFDFHTKKVTMDPCTFSNEHIVNMDDVVIFINFGKNSETVRTFLQHNVVMGLEHRVYNTEDDIVIGTPADKNVKFILVVAPFSDTTDKYMDIIDTHHSRINMVVYDTDVSHESIMMLSTCKRHGIAHVKRIQHSNLFNFGVVNNYEQCCTNRDDTNNGVISLDDSVVVGDRSYIVFLDPRYADMRKYINAMEICTDVWTVTVIHVCSDEITKGMYDYKFLPVYQTDNLSKLHGTVKAGLVHTPVSFYTIYPGIATMLFDGSIFVSCDKRHLLEYVNKVSGIFKKRINDNFITHIDGVNRAKYLTTEMSRKIYYVKYAILQHNRNKTKATLLEALGGLKIVG
jgi:hypothetical protein